MISQQLHDLSQPAGDQVKIDLRQPIKRYKGKMPPSEVAELYLSGWTSNEIAAKFRADTSSVLRCLWAHGIKTRSKQEAGVLSRRFNDYEICGNVVKLIATSKSGQTHEILIDAVDLPLLQEPGVRWRVDRRKHTSYALAAYRGRTVYLHRFLVGLYSPEHVDHWNHNGLDNRRENLRCTDRSGNMLNRKGTCARSGTRGVYWAGRIGKWVARVQGVHLGVFNDKKAAAIAVRNRLIELGAVKEISA